MVTTEVVQKIDERFPKVTKPETFQWDVPLGFNMTSMPKVKQKPEGYISYQTLRNFSVNYPVARACIDYLKTKIIKLNWKIVPANDEDTLDKNDPRLEILNDFFKHPMGYRSKYRAFIDAILEDYLVIGAVAIERLRTRGQMFLGALKMVDAATISIYVDDSGRLPEPPQPAFAQMVRGQKVAELTQDELIYETRNARTNTMFGLSPIESIIVQAEAAMQGSLYSLNWFKEGNIPEGFGELPENWSLDQIKKFQASFDALLAGNPKYQTRIKMVPKGFNYTPAKKPESVGYERFELWILQLTCTVFGVPPQDIGFTHQVNKSSSDTQQEMGQERGMRPIAQFLEDMFTAIIQDDFGFKDLKFSYIDVDPTDKKVEAEIDSIRIRDGVYSVDEVRAREGLAPINLPHYVEGNVKLVSDLLKPPEDDVALDKDGQPIEDKEEPAKEDDQEDGEVDQTEKKELSLWRKQSLHALKRGQSFKKFKSNILEDDTIEEIYDQLGHVSTKEGVLKVFEPYFDNSMKTLKVLKKLSHDVATITTPKN